MKRFWLGVALFLVVLTGTLPVLNLATSPKAAAAAGFHFGADNDPDNFNVQVKVIDGAHMQVTAKGAYDMADGTKINVGPLLSGMYYDRDIGDNWGRTDKSSDANYAQGGDKKVGVTDGCQSSIRISFKEYLDLDKDYNQYMDKNGIANNVKGIYFKFQFSTKGTNATGCIQTDYFSYDNPYTLLQDKENFNIGYFFSSLSEAPVNDVQTIQGGVISEVDNDGTYDSSANGKFTATFTSNNNFKFSTDHPHWGGRCPNYITVGGTGNLANTRAGQLKDQDNADNNSCKLTGGDGNPRAVLILTNKPSEVVQGNTDPNPAGDDNTVGQIYNDKCPIDTWGLKWIVCPIIEAINKTIESLSQSIQDYISFDAKTVFENDAVKKAFDSFRVIAISVLITVAVFMVVSNASGLDFLDAYTIKRYMPQFAATLFILVILWPLLYWVTSAFSALSHWIVDIMYAPFSELGDAKAADGWTILTSIGVGGALFAALGPFGLISLMISAFIAIFVAIIIITIVKMALTGTIIAFPAIVIMRIIPGTEKIAKIGLGVYVGTNLFPLAFGAAVALGKIGAVLMPGSGPIKSIGSTIAIIAPYIAAKDIAQACVGALNFVSGRVTGIGASLSKRGAASRQKIRQQRTQDLKAGSLMQQRGVGRLVNNIGRRANVGWKAGRFGFGQQGQAALQMQTALDQKQAMERNRWMQDLQNDDRANALLGLSGGSEAGMRQAARDIYTDAAGNYDEEAANLAMGKARAASGGTLNRSAAAAALQTMAQNKSRAIGAGRTDIVDAGIQRLAGSNQQELEALRYGYQYNSRNAGRNDLGGDWTGGDVRREAAALAASDASVFQGADGNPNQNAIRVANSLDGMGRTTVPQMMNGHTNQARANVDAIQQTLQHGNDAMRMEALYRANEIAKNLSSANGDSQAVFNDFIERNLGVDTGSAIPISQQLARRQLGPGASRTDVDQLSNRIENGSRAYGNAMAYASGSAAPAGGSKPPGTP